MDNNKVREAVETVRKGDRKADTATGFVRGDVVEGDVRKDEAPAKQDDVKKDD